MLFRPLDSYIPLSLSFTSQTVRSSERVWFLLCNTEESPYVEEDCYNLPILLLLFLFLSTHA